MQARVNISFVPITPQAQLFGRHSLWRSLFTLKSGPLGKGLMFQPPELLPPFTPMKLWWKRQLMELRLNPPFLEVKPSTWQRLGQMEWTQERRPQVDLFRFMQSTIPPRQQLRC